ncbi:MAG: hypothetical protein ACO1ON_06470 [Nocardioides sp.]
MTLTAQPTVQHELAPSTLSRLAWPGAWAALVLGQLHALARHRTEDGRSDLDLPLTRAWAEPAGDLLRPLLDWGSADLVYVTYGKVWFPLMVLATVAAFAAHRDRSPISKERWVWRVLLVGMVGGTASCFAEYWLQWGSTTTDLLETVFLVTVPFLLVLVLASTTLGVVLLVKRGAPRPSALLLALTLPGLFAITMVTSLGSILLPVMFAFGWWVRTISD